MKFNCGESKALKLKRAVEYYANWHRHFAWFPIRVGECDCRWLEVVWRRAQNDLQAEFYIKYGAIPEWEYKPFKKDL